MSEAADKRAQDWRLPNGYHNGSETEHQRQQVGPEYAHG
jgi:hypothetical protein